MESKLELVILVVSTLVANTAPPYPGVEWWVKVLLWIFSFSMKFKAKPPPFYVPLLWEKVDLSIVTVLLSLSNITLPSLYKDWKPVKREFSIVK